MPTHSFPLRLRLPTSSVRRIVSNVRDCSDAMHGPFSSIDKAGRPGALHGVPLSLH